MTKDRRVFIVDDDPAICDSLRALLSAEAYDVETFGSANDFLQSGFVGEPGCAIVDIRLPDMGGLELQTQITSRNRNLPVIIITGHGDVPLAVRAMRAGAVDFLEKPFDPEQLLASVKSANMRITGRTDDVAREKIARLTKREQEVLELIVSGLANKVIARQLTISPRTVEIHRARIMEKMEARSLAQLVRMAISAQITPL
jgi:two-component system response regulator FixJ